jgi:hypothetical protein
LSLPTGRRDRAQGADHLKPQGLRHTPPSSDPSFCRAAGSSSGSSIYTIRLIFSSISHTPSRGERRNLRGVARKIRIASPRITLPISGERPVSDRRFARDVLIGRRDGIQIAARNFGSRQGAKEGGYPCGL